MNRLLGIALLVHSFPLYMMVSTYVVSSIIICKSVEPIPHNLFSLQCSYDRNNRFFLDFKFNALYVFVQKNTLNVKRGIQIKGFARSELKDLREAFGASKLLHGGHHTVISK